MPRTLRDVALDKSDKNSLFAGRIESEVVSEYSLLALIAEMSMDQRHQTYVPASTFSKRSRAMAEAKKSIEAFRVVGRQRPGQDS